jgi:hypothetical protein
MQLELDRQQRELDQEREYLRSARIRIPQSN